MEARNGLAVLLLAVAAGCGSQTSAPADGDQPLEPPPPIRAVDRPAADALAGWLDVDAGDRESVLTVSCADADPLPQEDGEPVPGAEEDAPPDECRSGEIATFCLSNRTPDGECETTPEEMQDELARIEKEQREQQRKFVEAVRPAPDSEPRAVAELDLSGGRKVDLIAWRTADRKLCTLTTITENRIEVGGGGPDGECMASGHCADICLTTSGLDDTLVLTGTVARSGDVLRIVTIDDRTAAYPLTGPVVRGSDRRVVLLELGRSDWRRLELRRGGERVDSVEIPAHRLKVERCWAELMGGELAEAPSDDATRRWRECVGDAEGWTAYPGDEEAEDFVDPEGAEAGEE